jgi:hypothetical protein
MWHSEPQDPAPDPYMINKYASVADPDPSDPYVFGSPGFESISQRYGSGSVVLRIRDVYPGSRILIFTHPAFRISEREVKKN